MKYKPPKLFILFIVCLLFMHCTKNANETTTDMRLTIFDKAGIKVAGAAVSFSESVYNYPNSSNTQISGADGTVYFSNVAVPLGLYYVYAEQGCRNNRGDTSFPRTLIPNTINSDSVIIYEKGLLIVKNNTTESYVVSSPFFNETLSASTQFNYESAPGNFIVHSYQSNMQGTGRDTLMHITCGDTSFITIPY